mgnify:FL=1|jgi:hypothetical protein|tara:strand:- start:422 stop:754 length:333 start_codon:yes stop_codon:yes gene_type:complete
MADCKCCGGFMGTKLPLAIQGVACASCIYEVNRAMLERKGSVADGFKRHEERLGERLEEMPKLGYWEAILIQEALNDHYPSLQWYRLQTSVREQKSRFREAKLIQKLTTK